MKLEISNYMREMQRRSAAARWSGVSTEEKRTKMSALAKARWAKTKRTTKRAEFCQDERVGPQVGVPGQAAAGGGVEMIDAAVN